MSSNAEESSISCILSTFSLTSNNKKEEGRFEKLAGLKKVLRSELNKTITVPECDAVLLAGALLLNECSAVKEQARLVTDINIRLWGNAVDPLSKWITQHSILPQIRNMNKFIEGNTPLHFAVLTGNFENIAFLLSKQADPFLKNAHGDKALELCQDYHRKLHGKSDVKRKRKRIKKTYDADDENESDYYNDDDDDDSTSSSSSNLFIDQLLTKKKVEKKKIHKKSNNNKKSNKTKNNKCKTKAKAVKKAVKHPKHVGYHGKNRYKNKRRNAKAKKNQSKAKKNASVKCVCVSSSDCSMTDITSSDDISSTDDTQSDYSSSVTLSDKLDIKLVHSSSDDTQSDYSSSYDEIHITSDDESSSTMSSILSISSSSSSSSDDYNKEDDEDNGAIKLLRESMNHNNDNENIHSQLVPIIIALSSINIFAESASLARIVKFICTLIFFVALHWLEGNSAAKMIVKVGVSIIYLVAMFGHRINEWKECIDAETVLRKQQWTKQRDKERQKRKDRLQKTLRNADSKRCVAKKQRKLDRETCYKQDIFDWRSRIRMMINHAESAFLQSKYVMAEIYFDRLLAFLMENETDSHMFLNERKRANLKINRRWKGVFDDHYSIPIAKMFSRRAYCLCKIKNGEYPHSAPANNSMYKSISGHLELAVNDLTIAIALREISPLYQSFIKLYQVKDDNDDIDIWSTFEKKLDRLVVIVASQLCDLLSLALLHDLNDEFEKAYANTLQADDVIHCLNKFNKEYIQSGLLMDIIKNSKQQTVNDNKDNVDNNESEMESKRILATIQNIQQSKSDDKHTSYCNVLDGNGNFKLCLDDMIPLKNIESFLTRKKNIKYKKSIKLKMVEENKVDDDNIKRSKSMISLYSGDIDNTQLDSLLKHPLRQNIDLTDYKQLIGVEKCAIKAQGIIDQQLKKIRLLRLQAANRQRAVTLRNEREKAKHNKLNDDRIMKQAKKKENKKYKKNEKDKISRKALDKNDERLNPSTPSSVASGTSTSLSMSSEAMSVSTSASFSVIRSDKEDEEETKMDNNNKANKNKMRKKKIKLKKLKKKNKNKIGKKRTKKNQTKKKKKKDENDERLSISSINTDIAEEEEEEEEDDSLSILSVSTSSESVKMAAKPPKIVTNKKKKPFKSTPPMDGNRPNRRSPKNRNYRKKVCDFFDKKGKEIADERDSNLDEEPRQHWLWNINCDFWPNCRNSHQCAFKHPTDKGSVVRRRRTTPRCGDNIGKPIMCRFGRDCSRIDCWFWHPGDDETFIDPNTNNNNKDNQSISSGNTDNAKSDNSYELIDDKVFEEERAVIISKKPITNPWHKKRINKKVTVGAVYNEYDINNMIRSKKNKNNNRNRSSSNPVVPTYITPSGQKIKSSLNPHASAFNNVVSPPFDPHSQRINGGVFTPHNNNNNNYDYDEYKTVDNPMYYDYGDESKVVEAKVVEKKKWICPSCSFLNEIGTAACDLCSALPPNDKHKDNEEESQEESPLDFDFNIHDIINSNNDVDLSFNSLFFGTTNHDEEFNHFNVGDHIIHNDASAEQIQGVVAEIRDRTESSFPIRIEYYTINQFNKRITQFMWVLPSELTKVNQNQYDDDQLYDYDDVDDDDDDD